MDQRPGQLVVIASSCVMKTIITISFLCLSFSLNSQSIYNISKDYFRTDPFKHSFSNFVSQLINDPDLKEKKITKRSDSALFYFEGIYKSYSPFFIPVDYCKIILAEKEDRTDDSTRTPFLYYEYQLIGYSGVSKESLKDVKQEFDKLNKKFSRTLSLEETRELKRNNEVAGNIINYSYKNMTFIPVTLAWASLMEPQGNIIAITLRFLNINNAAYLPIPANSP
jgi:hypothetical protein